MLAEIFKKILEHKLIAGIILISILIGAYFGYGRIFTDNDAVRYITAQVQKGTLIVSVSGSGQVNVSDQIDVKPKVTSEIKNIYINKDQTVRNNQLLIELDSQKAEQAIKEAEKSLEEAIFALEKIETSKKDAEENLSKAYEDIFSTLSETFRNLPAIIDDLREMSTESSYRGDQADIDYYRNTVSTYTKQFFPLHEQKETYLFIYEKYDEVRRRFYLITPSSSTEILESSLNETYNLVKEMTDLVQSARNIAQLYKNFIDKQSIRTPIPISTTESQITSLDNKLNSLNQYLANLLSLKQTIDNHKKSISNYEKDIQSQKFIIEQKENNLSDRKEELANHYIRAPFDGVIAKVNVKKGDSVSSATVLATLITKQKIAEISLNEIDAANVKVGQKATLTFDAVPDLTITGEVIEIDAIGTVSQGVVSYTVKISFDTDDKRIKPGMSVSASIVIKAKSITLLVPNSAIKQQNGISYVEVPDKSDINTAKASPSGAVFENPLYQQQVEIGITNDTFTEILSGLNEKDLVVTRTIQPSSIQSIQTQQSSSIRIPGVTGGFGR